MYMLKGYVQLKGYFGNNSIMYNLYMLFKVRTHINDLFLPILTKHTPTRRKTRLEEHLHQLEGRQDLKFFY